MSPGGLDYYRSYWSRWSLRARWSLSTRRPRGSSSIRRSSITIRRSSTRVSFSVRGSPTSVRISPSIRGSLISMWSSRTITITISFQALSYSCYWSSLHICASLEGVLLNSSGDSIYPSLNRIPHRRRPRSIHLCNGRNILSSHRWG